VPEDFGYLCEVDAPDDDFLELGDGEGVAVLGQVVCFPDLVAELSEGWHGDCIVVESESNLFHVVHEIVLSDDLLGLRAMFE
jgi:hypothetical protein